MAHNSPEHVAKYLDRIDSDTFDKEAFEAAGIFILRNAIPKELMNDWVNEWNMFYDTRLKNGRDVNMANPVALKEPLPEKLNNIYKNSIVLDHVERVFGPHIGIYHNRFVIKDKYSPGEVFLHHDYCYHAGFPVKASFFIPITYSGKKNGGLTFYAGTHKYGSLGDAGEIDPAQFKEVWPEVTPELNPGDIAIMNSLVWHKSGINENGEDRIVADIIYQPANDPSCIELVRGDWQTDIFFNRDVDVKTYFKRSRVTKIVDLTNQLKEKEKENAGK